MERQHLEDKGDILLSPFSSSLIFYKINVIIFIENKKGTDSMVVFEDECVGCDTYCINCGRKHTPHYYCDECGEEIDYDEVNDPEGNIHYCSECSRKLDEEYEDEEEEE